MDIPIGRRIGCAFLAFVLAFGMSVITQMPAYAASDTSAMQIYGLYDESEYNVAVGGAIQFEDADGLALSSDSPCIAIDGDGQITGVSAGTATISWTDDGQDCHATIRVYSGSLPQRSYTKRVKKDEYGGVSTTVNVKVAGIDSNSRVQLEQDSLDASYVGNVDGAKQTVSVFLYKKGKHVLTLNVDGKRYQVTIDVKVVSLSTTYVMLKKGGTKKLRVRNGKATSWRSSKKSVARVSSKGKVTAHKKGIAKITAKVDGFTLHCRIEVTSKKAYRAVKNGLSDVKKKLKYSQRKRMAKSRRDCSSFVSRCYWDPSLHRKLLIIGGQGARYWAYNAASQAKWLNKHHRRVAYSAVSKNKLLPGDTIYYETDYAGKNKEYRHIDHAALYIGNGLILQTGGWGGKGTVGFGTYYPGDKSVKFIGRPAR
ncbi:MAG: Ig-like domain-containing protein [Eggerthellaceae bacterium]|jgi:cell wall-associated NlpC family hydrolase